MTEEVEVTTDAETSEYSEGNDVTNVVAQIIAFVAAWFPAHKASKQLFNLKV